MNRTHDSESWRLGSNPSPAACKIDKDFYGLILNYMNKNGEKPLTEKGLANFTEKTLLPAVEDIVDNKISKAKLELGETIDTKINKAKLELMDHIDAKNADLRGDIILLLRKDERRFLHLIDILYQKKVLNKEDIKTIEELQLFPKPSA